MVDKQVSKVMKRMRSRRKNYSTAGFKDPEVQKKALETRRKNKEAKNVQSEV